MRRKSLVEMLMKCQGNSDIREGKVREMSGNFDIAGVWETCWLHYIKVSLIRLVCCMFQVMKKFGMDVWM